MSIEPTEWQKANAGRASESFGSANRGLIGSEKASGRESEMVRRSKPSLAEGPKPPGHLRYAAKKQAFESDWRSEQRNASKQVGKRVYAEFTKAKGRGRSR